MVKALENKRKFKSLDPLVKVELIEIAKTFLFSVSFDTLATLENNNMLDCEKLEKVIESKDPQISKTQK